MKDKNSKSLGISIIVAGIVILALEVFFTYFDNERIWYSDDKTTTATVVSLGKKYTKRIRSESTFIGRLHARGEYRYVHYAYVVDGVEYINGNSYRTYLTDALEIGEKISITYSEEYHERSVIGKLQGISKYDLSIIIFLLVFGILIVVGSESIDDIKKEVNMDNTNKSKLKSAGKCIELIVQKIEFIDIDRERIFFKDKNEINYFYETDFGEKFKINESYLVNLRVRNKKKVKAEFNNSIQKGIQIVEIEASEFLEKV